MTPREHAEKLYLDISGQTFDEATHREKAVAIYERAIREAVNEAYDLAANIVRVQLGTYPMPWHEIATRIRAQRSQP